MLLPRDVQKVSKLLAKLVTFLCKHYFEGGSDNSVARPRNKQQIYETKANNPTVIYTHT